MNTRHFIFLFFSLCTPAALICQVKNAPVQEPQRKNIVRVNVSYPVLFGGNNLILGYERIIKPYQSISVNVGLTSLPKFTDFDLDSLSIGQNSETSGYNVSADYRFYLQKENKFLAPRGVYVGPYTFYYNFKRENELEFESDGVVKGLNSEMKLNIFGGGVELGYQFLFWKRMAVDLVLIGPGIASYNFKATVDGEIDSDEASEVADALKEWVENKFPGADFVWGDKSLDANGTLRTTTIGFRYLIHIGYYF